MKLKTVKPQVLWSFEGLQKGNVRLGDFRQNDNFSLNEFMRDLFLKNPFDQKVSQDEFQFGIT